MLHITYANHTRVRFLYTGVAQLWSLYLFWVQTNLKKMRKKMLSQLCSIIWNIPIRLNSRWLWNSTRILLASSPITKFWQLKLTKVQSAPSIFFAMHSIVTFLVEILSVEQKVAEFLNNSGQNSDKIKQPRCSQEWQWVLFHTLQVFHMSLVLHKTFQRESQAGINNFRLKIMRWILFSDTYWIFIWFKFGVRS